MPLAPARYCVTPGCGVLIRGDGYKGRCPTHAAGRERQRPNVDIRKWYYTPHWFHLKRSVLVAAVYTCAQCGIIRTDLVVDHIVKHEGQAELFWDIHNLQALCPTCHGRKTARGA
jgi:5-methylcytosine-specific restriction protein A